MFDWQGGLLRRYITRCPSGLQLNAARQLSSPPSRNFRACSPFGPISQISRSPYLPMLVPKAIDEPSGDTDQPRALSRSLCGAPPLTANIQTLLVCDDHSLPFSSTGCALAINRVLSGNQEAWRISQFTPAPLGKSGGGTVRTSPVSTIWICIPLVSLNARYFPSGEIAPPCTGFSGELKVSCRSFSSGRAARGRFLIHTTVETTRMAKIPAAAPNQRSVCGFGRRSCLKLSKSARNSAADW